MAATTLKLVVLLSFAGFVSPLVLLTVAVFDTGPTVDGACTTMVIVALEPLLSEPTEQVTVVVPLQLPCVAFAEVKLVPAGKTSVTVTPVAVPGPLFVTTMVKVSVPFGRLAAGVTVLTIATSGALTTVDAVALLLAGVESGDVAPTFAVFEIVEPAGAVVATVSVNEPVAAFASVAIVQVTVPVPPTAGVVQLQPPGDESDVNVVFAGSVSVSETLCATVGPLLVTLIV